MDPSEMYSICMRSLRDFVKEAGFSDVVIGLSGGIDSSVVAVMAADALGPAAVHGVLMPGPYSSQESIDDAEELASIVGIETATIPILEPFEAFEAVLARPCGGELSGLAAENTQARCRMVCLMAVSNAQGWLVLNTGNKSEAMMGYSTLYGDTCGAFAPLGGLYKTEVYELARWRNSWALERGQRPPIPEQIITKPPSAELAPNQSDEESMGIDYGTLDGILKAAFEHHLSSEEIAARGFNKVQVYNVLRRVESYAYKRDQEPPYPEAAFYVL